MKEQKERAPFEAAIRIYGALNWPGEKRSLRAQADILIQDAIEKRPIAKAGRVLEEKIGKGKI